MIASNDTEEAPLWVTGSGRPRPRQVPARCALCKDPPASTFGLCTRHLTAAAAEAARLLPRPAPSDDRRSSSVPFSALCTRCGRPGHDQRTCDA